VVVVNADRISAAVLERVGLEKGTKRVLFSTRNSDCWKSGPCAFARDFVAVSADGARWLVDHGVRLVGVDYLSVAPFGHSAPVHRCLLQAGVIIVEGLNLSGIPAGGYQLVCLPLNIVGADGAPARAILIG
jgi:arylformamidase